MTDTPLDLSKRYKTMMTGSRVFGLCVLPNRYGEPHRLGGIIVHAVGDSEAGEFYAAEYWFLDGTHVYSGLDLIPCEDE